MPKGLPSVRRISDLERRYVSEVLDTDFRSSRGSGMTRRLEEAFARLCNVKYAIAHVNGTATLHAALVAAGVGPGDEVIVPPLTMASTAFAVLQANGVPVFADIEPETWTLDPTAVAACISERTKAIMPVALYGLMPDMDPLLELARRHNLAVIEDDAECFLGYYKGRISGSMGHLSSFSFQSSKHLTAGEGGIVVTDHEDLALAVRRFNSLGYAGVGTHKAKITKEDIQDPGYARHVTMGFNYRMPELCAAVALAQTERIEELVDARVRSAGMLRDALSGCSWLLPQATPPDMVNSYWTFVVRLADDAPASWHGFRDRFRALGGDGIYAAWRLNYLEPAFLEDRLYANGKPFVDAMRQGGITQKYASGLCTVAERIQPRLLQFKTNYWNAEASERQAEVLRRTIASLQ
jgi:perosamine synthetase